MRRAAVSCLFVIALAKLASSAIPDVAPEAMLWKDPGAIADRDVFFGPWGAERAPDPHATYTYLRPKHHGVNPGMIVRDGGGRVWHVKQPPNNSHGAEGPVEVVLSRVLSAVGYHQPPVYFLPSFTVTDASGTHAVPGGRFRLDEPSMKARGSWSWKRNPFFRTPPYQGLLAILLVFNSWDLKDSNNTMYDVKQDGGVERWYVVRDLGAALGESGRLGPKRNNIDRFERQKFITGLSGGFVDFAYGGWQPDLLRHAITVDDVEWAVARLDGLSDRQWNDAFRAGGYDGDTAQRFIRKIKSNIAAARQLKAGVVTRADRRP